MEKSLIVDWAEMLWIKEETLHELMRKKMAPKKTNELNLIFVFVAHLLALVLDFLSSQTQTGAPFIQSDEVVVVHVARVEERADAVLERHQWGADREQFVAGHFPVFKNFQQLKLFFFSDF